MKTTGQVMIKGFIDGMQNGVAQGWVFSPDQQDMILEVEVLVDGEVVASGTAGNYREDLQVAGIGDGRHAFSIPIPDHLAHDAAIQVREIVSGILLPSSRSHDTKEPVVAPPDNSLRGSFDGIVNGKARGWVYRPDQPDQILAVQILHKEQILACQPAGDFRKDLEKANIGDGKHAFSIAIDARWKTSDCWVRETSTGRALKRSLAHAVCRIPVAKTRDLLQPAGTGQAAPQSTVEEVRERLAAASTALESGDFDVARTLLDALGVHGGDIPLLPCLYGELALLTGDTKGALVAYQTAFNRAPHSFWVHVGMGDALSGCEEYDAAENAYMVALTIQPNAAGIHAKLQNLLLKLLPLRFERLLREGKEDAAWSQLARYAIKHFANDSLVEFILNIIEQKQHSLDFTGGEDVLRTTAIQLLLEAVMREAEALMQKQAIT